MVRLSVQHSGSQLYRLSQATMHAACALKHEGPSHVSFCIMFCRRTGLQVQAPQLRDVLSQPSWSTEVGERQQWHGL